MRMITQHWNHVRPCYIAVGVFIAVASAAIATAEAPYAPAWVRQIGTDQRDRTFGVAVDGLGNAYFTGYTEGSLGGPHVLNRDVFLIKYDAGGNHLWSRQLGTTFADEGYSVAADAVGNTYVSGYTTGSLGGPTVGFSDGFLLKYDPAGSLLWSRQIGTGSPDWGQSVAIDSLGNAYLTGTTRGDLGGINAGGPNDVFLSKYDGDGNHVWSRQLGTIADDYGYSVAADALGNVFISGHTFGDLASANAGGRDAFLAKYTADGIQLWTRQLASDNDDFGNSVAVDGTGNAYVGGTTNSNLAGPFLGGSDVFVIKYDADGNELWSQQVGTTAVDHAESLAVDSGGNTYISGWTRGSLGGTNAGADDAFLTKLDANGNPLWSQQFGLAGNDVGQAVAVDNLGRVYVAGHTDGDLGGPNAGDYDAILVKFAPVPLPSAVWAGLVGISVLVAGSYRRRVKMRQPR